MQSPNKSMDNLSQFSQNDSIVVSIVDELARLKTKVS